MRCLALAAIAFVALLAAASVGSAEPPVSRIDRLEEWLVAVSRHDPGVADENIEMVGGWSIGELRMLWLDLNSLVMLMRAPNARGIVLKTPGKNGKNTPERVPYSRHEWDRIRALAQAAEGIPAEETRFSAALRRLSNRVRAAKLRGDQNYVVKRGALLHTDAAMLHPTVIGPAEVARAQGPQRLAMPVKDGRQLGLGSAAVHWEIARFLLGVVLPDPAHDAMVREWYGASVAYMQREQEHDELHLSIALDLFSDDPRFKFLAGCLHETFASAAVQNAVNSAPGDVKFGVESVRFEMRKAEAFFRRALEIDPSLVEARLRHGRVLGLLDRHADARTELLQTIAATEDSLLLYYGELFLGAEEETLGNRDAARAAYERATQLYPLAQSPQLALSQLARRNGDRAGALKAMDRVLSLNSDGAEPDDPWWTYHVAQGRNTEALFIELWKPFLDEARP